MLPLSLTARAQFYQGLREQKLLGDAEGSEELRMALQGWAQLIGIRYL